MRVHELAAKLGKTAKELIPVLIESGFNVSNHMSGIDDDLINQWLKKTGAGAVGQTKPKATQKVQKVVAGEVSDVSNAKELVEKELEQKDDDASLDEEEIILKRKPTRPKKNTLSDDKQGLPKESEQIPVDSGDISEVSIGKDIQIRELSDLLDKSVTAVIGKLMELGVMANQNQKIDHETAAIVAHEFGFEVSMEEKEAPEIIPEVQEEEEEVDASLLITKAPVVTFMGHVDHGKTSLLDCIRKSKVADGEAGKITQHMGAYEVSFQGGRIIFLDTPGHKAFSAMRSRGANATDIVVLVVAADDGIMEQTREAISHARAADVPIIVAINKIDKENADIDKVLRQLSEVELMPEDWGGETICVKVSAIKEEGIDHLLEMIHMQAEMMELKANPVASCRGIVIESKMTRGRGPTITVLVQRGILRVGDPVICGSFSGKVKALINDKGKNVKEAGPATPVNVLGLDGVPDAGDILELSLSAKEAKRVADERKASDRKTVLENINKPTTLEELYEKIEAEEAKELKIIIKGDVHGSIEALGQSLEGLSNDKIGVRIIHQAVGDISESDIVLASASDAIVIGFCIRVDKRAREIAGKEDIEIKTYNIIYEAIEDVYLAMSGLLGTKSVEEVVGLAEVRETFKISRLGVIAGCYVKDGKAIRNAKVRLRRDDEELFNGDLSALKRFKDEVKEVRSGMECGIKLDKFDNIKIGDEIEFYIINKVQQTF